MTKYTAQLVAEEDSVQHEVDFYPAPPTVDRITIRDENDVEVDVISVESDVHPSVSAEPFDAAVRAAGYTDYRWIMGRRWQW